MIQDSDMKIQLPVLPIQFSDDLPQMFLTALPCQINIGWFHLKQFRNPVDRFPLYREKIEDLVGLRLDPVFQNEDAQKCWKGFFGWGIFYYKGKYFIVDEGWDLTSPNSPRNKYPDKTYNTISEVEQFFIDTWNDWEFETRITALSHLNADLKVSIQVELQ